MHVLQLGPYPPPEGGVSRNMLAIRNALAERGHTCSIIATTRSGDVKDESGVYRPGSPAALLKLLQSLCYDVLHLHVGGDISPRVLALAAGCTLFGKGSKVLTIHSGGYPQTTEARAARAYSARGFIFRRFDRIITVSEQLFNVFDRYGVSSDRLRVIQPYAFIAPDDNVQVRPELRDFYTSHTPVLLAVGGLEPEYDPLFQVAAMKDVLARYPGAGLVLVGDGSMRSEVEIAVAENGYNDQIKIAGNVDHAQTLHLIRDADVLLRTTLFDGDAISIREALYLGTKVIATDTAVRPDGVHLIKQGDAAALVRGLAAPANISSISGLKKSPTEDGIGAIMRLYEEIVRDV